MTEAKEWKKMQERVITHAGVKKLICLLFAGILLTKVFCEELSGTITSSRTLTDSYNRINPGETVIVKSGVTLILDNDLENWGTLIVEKGASFKASKEGAGFIEFHQNAVITGVDFYYKIIGPDGSPGTFKIPQPIDEICKGNNRDAKDYIVNRRFCWSEELNGWVPKNNAVMRGNPFNDPILEKWPQVWDKSKTVDNLSVRYGSILVKKNADIYLNDKCPDFIEVEDFITVEAGGTLKAHHTNILVNRFCKITGLPLYCRSFDQKLYKITNLDKLWEIDAFRSPNNMLEYDSTLDGWVCKYYVDLNSYSKNDMTVFNASTELM